MELNYEEDIRIDHTALDVEWLRQPELMRRYTKHQAETERAKSEAKEHLQVGKAQIELEIRANPKKFGLEKSTEAAIQSAVLLHPDYQKLSQEFLSAKYEDDIARGAIAAMEQRKAALENLVRLLNASYFAGPKAPRELSDAVRGWLKDKELKERNARIRIRQRTRKREGTKEEKEEEE